ncbi:hypothetical protein H4219_004078 [Mycoemilia scoparia]|uniref:Uncharacterized protein n=1 Tax=Mycoemilia scoparia TaxID=417184 RepID=A0A9W8A0X5_9FUNG|nr:hypothetical protein H4219_004078 [Mycoemilia scoparia]
MSVILVVGGACVLSEFVKAILTTKGFALSYILANVLGSAFFLFPSWMFDKWVVQPRFAREYGIISDARYWSLGSDIPNPFDIDGNQSNNDGTRGQYANVPLHALEEFDLELNDIIMGESDEDGDVDLNNIDYQSSNDSIDTPDHQQQQRPKNPPL